jgi:hypothetical protein
MEWEEPAEERGPAAFLGVVVWVWWERERVESRDSEVAFPRGVRDPARLLATSVLLPERQVACSSETSPLPLALL